MREKTVLSLSYGRIVVKPPDRLTGLVPESFETYQIVEPGDIVIRATDLQNDKTSLRVGFVRNRGIITSAYLTLQTSGELLPEYGYLLIHALDLTKMLYGLGSGLRQNLSYADFKRLPVFVPPPEEQAAIVRYLDWACGRLDRAIRAKRKIIALLNEQKQAIVHRVLTQGLDRSRARKETRSRWFPLIPSDWDVVTLGRVIHAAIDGPHFSPAYVDTGIPFLSARNIRADRWQLADAKFISRSDYEEFCKRVRPEIEDVLFTKGGTTGVARVVDLDFPFQVWVHVAVLKVSRRLIHPEYLSLSLNSPRCYEQSQLFTRGATNQDLGLGRMKQIELPVPPTLQEQECIVTNLANELSGSNRAIGRAEREISLIREYRTRLIADVVTGKLDVREVAAKLPAEQTLEVADEAVDEDVEELAEELTEAVN